MVGMSQLLRRHEAQTAKPHTWEDPPRGYSEDLGYFLFLTASDTKKVTCLVKERQSTQAIQSKIVRADIDVVGL
jgi:hypothetical protein